MIKSYNVTVYEQYYESTYETDNLQFSTEDEAKEFEEKIALRYMTNVMRFFRKRVPDAGIVKISKEISNFGDGKLDPFSPKKTVDVLQGKNGTTLANLDEIKWHYNIRRGILRIGSGEGGEFVKIYSYNEETGQWYKEDDTGGVILQSDWCDALEPSQDQQQPIPANYKYLYSWGNEINTDNPSIRNYQRVFYSPSIERNMPGLVYVMDQQCYYQYTGNITQEYDQTKWAVADDQTIADFKEAFAWEIEQDRLAAIAAKQNEEANWPWWKKLIHRIFEALKKIGQTIAQWIRDLIDLIKGTAYIGYIIDFSWTPKLEEYPSYINTLPTQEERDAAIEAFETSFREMYETAEALQLSICTRFFTSRQAVKHFNNIIDVMNNIRDYDFPTNDNKIINNWDGTQNNEFDHYYDGGYYVYDKVRGWITAMEAYNDGIL